jgi:peptidoglycan hydrolase CwlO-like protein
MFSHKDEENKKKHTEKVRLEREIGHQDEEIEDLMKKIDKEDRKIDQ